MTNDGRIGVLRARATREVAAWAALGPETNEKRPPDTGRRWEVSSQVRGRFQALSRWAALTLD